jgi:hypothetical protein
MNIRINKVLEIVHQRYEINKRRLEPYQIILPNIITESSEVISHYKHGSIKFAEPTKQKIMIFLQDNEGIFNEIIEQINNC